MFKNYWKTAFRNIIKRKGYSLLNIAGLTIGMTCCLLIFHYVAYEKSYDRFNKQAGNIVRLRLDTYQNGVLAWKSATIYPAIGPALKKDYPEVQNFCRLMDAEGLFINEATNAKFNETKGYFADQSSIGILGIELLEGTAGEALTGPNKIVISETLAKKFFGSGKAVGKRVSGNAVSRLVSYEVTGVMKDYPVNSHLDIRYLLSYPTLGSILRLGGDSSNATETSFGWYDFYTYLQLRPGTDPDQFEKKLPDFCNRYINNNQWNKTNNRKAALHIIPLTDIHLHSNYNQEAEVNGNGQAVGFLFLVAIFIIGIAWINYINLSTARSVERAREVGVRKVLGAARSSLVYQFLAESFLLNLFSFLLSLLLFYLLLPSFDHFVGKDATGIGLTSRYWQLFMAVFIGGTLLSGIYPAFVLSGFQPIKVLKGIFKNSSGGLVLRKGLIVVQFMTSVVLIAGTIIVYQQVTFMRQQQLGFNIDQTLIVEGAGSIPDSLYNPAAEPFKTELLRQSNIKSVTASSSIMGDEILWTNSFKRIGPDNPSAITLYILGVDYDFISAYGLHLLAGRSFSKDYGTDARSVLLNEEAVRQLGFGSTSQAIGGKVKRNRDTLTVCGVVANYHHQGLQKAIEPMLILLTNEQRTYYSVKVSTDRLPATIAHISSTWNKYFPAHPISYSFLDEKFDQQYKADELFGKVFSIFAFLAILIASFGLLGLSAYNVLQRTKEIGVRKVLGANSQQILLLLSKDFLKLILVALLLAIPVCWYIMYHWLQDFAFRIHIAWWVFAIAGCLALLIALATIVLQSMRAVLENPVRSLRTE